MFLKWRWATAVSRKAWFPLQRVGVACRVHLSSKGFLLSRWEGFSQETQPSSPGLRNPRQSSARLCAEGLRYNPCSSSRQKPPTKSSPFLGVTSEVPRGKKAKVTAGAQTAGSPDYDACGFILRQHGSSGAEWPQLRVAEDCLRGACVALFLLLSIWKESASEMTKNRKTKIHTKEKKRPLTKAHHTHTILRASNKTRLQTSQHWLRTTSREDTLERGWLLGWCWHRGEGGGRQLAHPSRLAMTLKHGLE